MLEVNKKSWQLITAIFYLISINLYSKDDKKFEYFFKKLYQDRFETYNSPVLAVDLIKPQFNYSDFQDFPGSIGINIFYGFSRESSEFYYENFTYHSHEFAFGGNVSSKLLPESSLDKILDYWKFGVGWQNGYAYNLDFFKIFLIHQGTMNWNNLELNYQTDIQNLEKLQGDLRFGTSYSSGVMINLYKSINIGLFYEDYLVYPRYTFSNHILSWTIENILQRTPDYFEEELVKEFQEYYPIYYFIYKTSISSLLYHFRKGNMNWPINSSEPLNYNSIKIDLRFIF